MTEDPNGIPAEDTMDEVPEKDEGLTTQQRRGGGNKVIVMQKKPVMSYALEVMSILGSQGKTELKGKGNSIPTAVAVANVIVDKMMKGRSKIEKISVDSENSNGEQGGALISTIDILLVKEGSDYLQ